MSAPQPTLFDGQTYDPALDEDRLATALGRIYAAMVSGREYSLRELAAIGRCSEAAASARVRDLRKRRFGAHSVASRRGTHTGLWLYRLTR